MRIVKIIPFYGSWPAYMDPYLESCGRNPMLTVTFVTDLDPFPRSPANVRYATLTFEGLKARIETLFGIKIGSIRPYKLCDFRPAYGTLFEDLLGDADFWGHGDNDMVLGSVRSFITPEKLERYDVLSFKKGHLHGPLTIYRNTPQVNQLFREGGHFRRVFADPAYLSFDEFGPSVFYTKVEAPSDVLAFPSDNISVIALKKALAGELRLYAEQACKEDLRHGEVIEYDGGRVFDARTGREYLFYHWVLEKRAVWFKYPAWFSRRPGRFYVATTGFYTVAEFRIYWLLHGWRLVKGTVVWFVLKAGNYVRRSMGRRVSLDTYPRVGWVKRLEGGA